MNTPINIVSAKVYQILIKTMLFFALSFGLVQAGEVFDYETVAGGFVLPTSFSFVDAETVIVGEKGGSVYMVDVNDGNKELIYTLPNVNTYNDRGLIGLAIHNDFLSNGYVYLSYTHDVNPSDNTGPKTARIVRVVYDFDTEKIDPDSYTVLVGNIVGSPENPSCDDFPAGSDCIASNSGAHSAGGLRFGPDGYLYASIGDGSDFYQADPHALNVQNLDYLVGKILRLNDDGTAPSTNPFFEINNPNSNRSKIYALGVRNSFRFDFMENGDLVAGEVGWYLHDELNLVEAGDNFGWPCYEGTDRQDSYFGAFPSECAQIASYKAPIIELGFDQSGESYAVVGGDEVTSATYGSYQGKYFFGDYSQNKVMSADYSSGNISNVETVLNNPGGPVDMQLSTDGTMYCLAIYTGEIRKIVVSGTEETANQTPFSDYYVDYALGNAPVMVNFHGEISSDPDGDDLTYVWDFGDGNFGSGSSPEHVYLENGSYTVILLVEDTEGLTSFKAGEVAIGEVEYDAKPVLINTDYEPQPQYVGFNSSLITTLENIEGGNDDYIIYWEVYNSANERVFDNSELVSGALKTEFTKTVSWLPPGIDTYRVAIGLFSDDWRKMYSWHNEALVFDVVQRDSIQPDEETGGQTEDPEPESDCYDHDGDGWGWDGEKGCQVDSVGVPRENLLAIISDLEVQATALGGEYESRDLESLDYEGLQQHLNDLLVQITTLQSAEPEPEPETSTDDCPAESDHDGDGWGWDGEKGCQIESGSGTEDEEGQSGGGNQGEEEGELEATACLAESDHDKDGWGWDGEKGCRIESTDEESEEPSDPEPVTTCPADSDHDGDGWGWDGEKGCRVGG